MTRPHVLTLRAFASAVLVLGPVGVLGPGCDILTEDPAGKHAYAQPPQTGDGWITARAGDVGLDEGRLTGLLEDLEGMADHRVHSVLVVRHGKLGFDRDDTHSLASVTKSVTSTLMGIALDRGALTSLQQPAFDFFPEHADLLESDPRRRSMTLEHLITMRAPIVWNDEVVPYSDTTNDLVRMFNVPDPMRHALSRPLYAAPGALFDYCNASTNILGDVVRRATWG